MVELLTVIAGTIVLLLAASMLIPSNANRTTHEDTTATHSSDDEHASDRHELIYQGAFSYWSQRNLRLSSGQPRPIEDNQPETKMFACKLRSITPKSAFDSKTNAMKRGEMQQAVQLGMLSDCPSDWYLLGLHWQAPLNHVNNNDVAAELLVRKTAMLWASYLDEVGLVAALGPTSIVCVMPLSPDSQTKNNRLATKYLVAVREKCFEAASKVGGDEVIAFRCVAKAVCQSTLSTLNSDLDCLEARLLETGQDDAIEYYVDGQWHVTDSAKDGIQRSDNNRVTELADDDSVPLISAEQAVEMFGKRSMKATAVAVPDTQVQVNPDEPMLNAKPKHESEELESVEVFARTKKAGQAAPPPPSNKPSVSDELDKAESDVRENINDLFKTVEAGKSKLQTGDTSATDASTEEPSDDDMTDSDIARLFEAARCVNV